MRSVVHDSENLDCDLLGCCCVVVYVTSVNQVNLFAEYKM